MTVNMSDTNNSCLAIEKDACVKKLKRNLDRWRELVLFLHSVLLWKKKAYPWATFAVVTFLFAEIALYDLSMVTITSLLLLVFTLVDFLAPIIVGAIVKDEWTASKQKELEDVCKILANVMISTKVYYASLMEVKATRPNLYYPVSLVTLCIFAWIGNCISNLFITYAIVLSIVMLPGLIHLGILQKYYRSLLSQDFVKNFNKAKAQ
uniref:ADP-ribosylation factor-like protein 6-interacting protein 1 n=1 Tax=Lygus hesperus TaxID=30085 RepID=A0A0A9YLA5_LYGHE